jgi:hypothetical protein
MCTVTFIPKAGGCLVGMNRDDLRSRPPALAPAVRRMKGAVAVYPREPEGGTWIGANDRGIVFTLLNWHVRKAVKRRTRGEVIPALLAADSLNAAGRALQAMQLSGMLPFRLVAFSTREKRICEWRWDGGRISRRSHPWRLGHWFSSGLSDRRAASARRPICEGAARQASAGSVAWLRRLHRSHRPRRGAFSFCVHRPEAATLSYTEILCRRSLTVMRYMAGNPCERRAVTAIAIRQRQAPT